MLSFLVGLLRSDYFGTQNIIEKVVNYLFVQDQRRFSLHICILIVVMFRLLQEKIHYFVYLYCCFSY